MKWFGINKMRMWTLYVSLAVLLGCLLAALYISFSGWSVYGLFARLYYRDYPPIFVTAKLNDKPVFITARIFEQKTYFVVLGAYVSMSSDVDQKTLKRVLGGFSANIEPGLKTEFLIEIHDRSGRVISAQRQSSLGVNVRSENYSYRIIGSYDLSPGLYTFKVVSLSSDDTKKAINDLTPFFGVTYRPPS